MKYILITGSPVNGFFYEGPFDDLDSALDIAEKKEGNWWFAPIREPEIKDWTIIGNKASKPISTSEFEATELEKLCSVVKRNLIGKKIIYKDGDVLNYNIDNLELVPIKNHHFDKEGIESWTEHQQIEHEIAQGDKELDEDDLEEKHGIDRQTAEGT